MIFYCALLLKKLCYYKQYHKDGSVYNAREESVTGLDCSMLRF